MCVNRVASKYPFLASTFQIFHLVVSQFCLEMPRGTMISQTIP